MENLNHCNFFCNTIMFSPINLEKLIGEEFNDFLNSIDYILCDCDGVVFDIYKMLNCSKEAINLLQEKGKNIKFITNNPKSELIIEKLINGGIKVSKDSVINPTIALVNYLKSINFNKKLYVIGLDSFKTQLKEAGVQISEESHERQTYDTMQGFLKSASDNLDDNVGAVLVCFDFNVCYSQINRAYRYVAEKNVPVIFTGNDRKLPLGNGKFCLGPGNFQDLIALASSKKPLCFGKPSKEFQEYITNFLKFNPSRTLFIGDSLVQDISFGKEMGFKTLLVLTGNSVLEDLDNCNEKFLPDYFVQSLGHFYKLM